MDDYIYSLELQHHGIKGMKWGVRRSKKQLARLTNRKKEDISDKEAADFRKEVKYAKKHGGVDFESEYDEKTGRITGTTFFNSRNEKIGASYARAIMAQEAKERTVRVLAGSAIVLAGTGFVASLLEK